MKKGTLLVAMVVILSASAFGQGSYHFKFTYDAAGNMTIREYVYVPPIEAPMRIDDPIENEEDFSQMSDAKRDSLKATIQKAGDFKFYPNPTTGNLRVEANDNFIGRSNKRLEIYDLNGRLVWVQDVKEAVFTMDFSGKRPGEYLIKVSAEGYKHEFVVVKQ